MEQFLNHHTASQTRSDENKNTTDPGLQIPLLDSPEHIFPMRQNFCFFLSKIQLYFKMFK